MVAMKSSLDYESTKLSSKRTKYIFKGVITQEIFIHALFKKKKVFKDVFQKKKKKD